MIDAFLWQNRAKCDRIFCDEFTFIASVWVHFPASLNQVLSSNINGISWTNCFNTEPFCFWNEKSPSKISTFSNIDLWIILAVSDMIMPSSVVELSDTLNNASPFSPSREKLRHFHFFVRITGEFFLKFPFSVEWHTRSL